MKTITLRILASPFPQELDNMCVPDRGVKTYLTGNEKRQQHLSYVSLSSAQHPLDRHLGTCSEPNF